MFVVVQTLPCPAWGSVLEPKHVHLCGLSMADCQHPICMATYDPSECACVKGQWVYMSGCA